MLKPNSLLPETEEGDPEQEFELLDLLGQGAYGQVNKALHKKTGELYAIKILSASNLSQINSIKKEIQILRLCDNQHIVKYYGSYFKDNNLWIVLEYCHAGSIIDLLNITHKRLDQSQIASILESTLKGLTYLHEHKKIHRDIKAANILLTIEGIAKLADFGVSTQSMYTNAGHKSQVGSPYWMSPEVMKHSEYTNKTDIWSLGVTAIELAEGVVPNSHLKPLIAMWQLKDKPVQGLKDPGSWSPQFNSFIKDCLNTNPNQRPEAKALLSHPFIVKYSKGQQLLSELVQRSLTQIEQFRLGQKDQDSEIDFTVLLNQSGTGTGTIVNKTQRSRQQVQEPQGFDDSMVINQENGSMIVNEQDSSMVVVQTKEKPATFLNQYISKMKNTENEVESQKEEMRKKIQNYDEMCLKELEELFQRHKQQMEKLLEGTLDQQISGLDQKFIEEELKSKLQMAKNVKEFICEFPKYQMAKEFERSELAKKKSNVSKIPTQANDPSSGDLQLFKEKQPHNVKSQEFTEKEFKTNEKHCFYSKSIISEIANVKDAKDFHQQQRKLRVVATEPVEWGGEVRPFMAPDEKHRLKQLFLDDPDVKDSILNHIRSGNKNQSFNKYNRDKVIAESTLYNDFTTEDSQMKHQCSTTLARGTSLTKNHFSEQPYLMPQEEFQEEDTETNVIKGFNPKGSAKLTKNWENKSVKRSKGKRSGVSMQKKGKGNYMSGRGQKKHVK